MKKAIKAIFILFLFLVVFPALAGFAVMTLWNNIVPVICGFSTITFWQSVGIFLMGQILTGGAIIVLLFLWGGLHALTHHRSDWHGHWHNMTDEQRREFIERRRREHFGFHNCRQDTREDAAK